MFRSRNPQVIIGVDTTELATSSGSRSQNPPQRATTTAELGSVGTMTMPGNLPDSSPTWDMYNEIAAADDKAFVEEMISALDQLMLVSPFLASAELPLFMESIKPPETGLLLALAEDRKLLRNSPAKYLLWFSFANTIIAFFVASFVKEIIRSYKREEGSSSSQEQARRRQLKFESREKYRLLGVVDGLAVMLEIVAFTLVAGISSFVHHKETEVALSGYAVLGFFFLIWILVNLLSLCNQTIHLQTPLSRLITLTFSRLITLAFSTRTMSSTSTTSIYPTLSIDIRITIYLLKNIKFSETTRLTTLAITFESYPAGVSLRIPAEVVTERYLKPMGVIQRTPLKDTQPSEYFVSLAMMRIIRVLLITPFTLEVDVEVALVRHVWLASQMSTTEPHVAEVVADIIAIKAIMVEAMRAYDHQLGQKLYVCLRTDCCAALVLATRLCNEVVERGDGGDGTAAWLNLFFYSLPRDHLESSSFTILFERLATFFENIAPDHPTVIHLANSMMEFYFKGQLGGDRQLTQDAINEMDVNPNFSTPILRMALVLFRSSILSHSNRRRVLALLLPQLWHTSTTPKCALIIADILALSATDVVNGDVQPETERGTSHCKRMSVLLASRLCRRLATLGEGERKSRRACSRLLKRYFFKEYHNTPSILQNLLQIKLGESQQFEEDATYLACLLPAFELCKPGSPWLTFILHNLDDYLFDLHKICGRNIGEWSATPLSASALAIFMGLWHNYKLSGNADAPRLLSANFYHPDWSVFLRHWLQQAPEDVGCHNFALVQASSMMDRISSCLVEIFQHPKRYHLSKAMMEKIRNDSENWRKWLTQPLEEPSSESSEDIEEPSQGSSEDIEGPS